MRRVRYATPHTISISVLRHGSQARLGQCGQARSVNELVSVCLHRRTASAPHFDVTLAAQSQWILAPAEADSTCCHVTMSVLFACLSFAWAWSPDPEGGFPQGSGAKEL